MDGGFGVCARPLPGSIKIGVKMKMINAFLSTYYRVFEDMLRQSDEVPEFVREHQFMPSREWKIGFAWPDISPRLAVEIEGGTISAAGIQEPARDNTDLKKCNSLAIHGFFLLRFRPQDIESGEALDTITDFFQVRRGMA